MKTYLSEIFSSVQGEGPYVGERHLFVRFCGCHRDCIFCDTNTERTDRVLVEPDAGSGNFETVPNPLTVEQVMELIRQVDRRKNNRRISLTGGGVSRRIEVRVDMFVSPLNGRIPVAIS